MKIYNICISCLFLMIQADTTILDTTTTPSYILSNIDKNSLVLFDIDFTLLQPLLFAFIDMPSWINNLASEFIAKSTNKSMDDPFLKNLIESYIIPTLATLRKYLMFTSTDTCMINLIKQLQKKDIPTLALTARMPIKNGKISAKQLKNIGINFSQSLLGKKKVTLPAPMLYNHGIIFSSGKNKGETLKLFLEKTNYKPNKIILVDDFLKNINDVAAVTEKMGIPFTGIRYAFIEAN